MIAAMDAKNSKINFVVTKLSIVLLYLIMTNVVNFFKKKSELRKYNWAHDCPVNGFHQIKQGKKCHWCDMSEQDEIQNHKDYHEKYKKRQKSLSELDLEKFFEI